MYDRTILETIEYHHSMLADKVRMQSYLQAILKTVEPGDVVLDIGSGTGILAYFACLAGAKRVYAVEQDPLVGLARTISRHNGFQDRVTFFNDWSDQIELTEPVDVIITETLGNIGFEEGILGWIIDAKERLLKETGQIIPQSVELIVVPTESHETFDFLDDWSTPVYALDFSAVGDVVANNLVGNLLSTNIFLSHPASIVQSELALVDSTDIRGEAQFVAGRDGIVRGLGCWFKSTLIPGITISNGPPFDTPSWTQIFLPLERPLPISTGDHLHVKVHADGNGAHWHWQVGQEHLDIAAKGQSTLSGQLLKADHQVDRLRKPIRSLEGKVDLVILQAMNGSTTLEGIARHIKSKFPLQFSTLEEALKHVNHVSQYYGRSANN